MKHIQHQQAYNLYFQTDLSQAQIAKLLDVDRKTIQNWLNEGNWRQLKKSAHHIPSKLVEQFYYMVANLNQEILGRAQQPYPLTHEVEELRKMTLCIRNLKNRQAINESIEAFTHLADILTHKDPELATRLRPHIQTYIKDRADFKFADCVGEQYQCDPNLGELFDYEKRPFDDDDNTNNSANNTNPTHDPDNPTHSPGDPSPASLPPDTSAAPLSVAA